MRPLGTVALPPTLATLMRPSTNAVETTSLGMGEHVSATAANAFVSIRQRIVMTPLLEHAMVQARERTDALVNVLDKPKASVTGPRFDALAALAELTG